MGYLNDKRGIFEPQGIFLRARARESSISSRRARILYIGDSRTRHFFGAHLRSLGLDSRMHSYYYSDARCKNNSYRYANEDTCSKAETRIDTVEQPLNFRACWRTNQDCFKQLSGSVASAEAYLQMAKHETVELFINMGLHDAVYRVSSPSVFKERVCKLFSTLAKTPNLKVTWLGLYPLMPPRPGNRAKFANFEELNILLRSLTNETNKAAASYGFRVFDIAELLPWKAEYSSDTVHLMEDVDDYLFLELTNTSFPNLLKDPLSLSKPPGRSDVSCGNQTYSFPGANETVSVAFFGGSVTSDNKYITGFKAFADSKFQWITSTINLGEPATGSLYQSLCWKQTSHAFNGTLASARFIIVEFCANDMDLQATSLRHLLLQLLATPSKPTILYYCHLSPRSRIRSLGQGGSTVYDKHWELANELGVIAIRDKVIIDSLLKREEQLFYRDAVHFNVPGGYLIGGRLAVALSICAKNKHQGVLLRNTAPTNLMDNAPTNLMDEISKTRCYTSLGPPECRNMHQIVSGWDFVQTRHVSAPNGKNGFETNISGSCLRISLNITCPPAVTLFYLISPWPDMGDAIVSIDNCAGYSEILTGESSGLSITAGKRLAVPSDCCSSHKNRTVNVCSKRRKHNVSNSNRFRVMAVATE